MAATARYAYVIEPTRPTMLRDGLTPREGEVVARHFAYLQELNRKGIVQLAGRTLTDDGTAFGITLLAVETEEEARTIMEQDPAVAEGVMTASLYPFRVALGGEVPPAP